MWGTLACSGRLGEGFVVIFVVDFVVLAAAEIDVLGLCEAAFAVDYGVDLVIRKNEAIFRRLVG